MTTDIKQAVRELREILADATRDEFGEHLRGRARIECVVVAVDSLNAVLDRLEELEREKAELTNARNYYEEVWKESCSHVGEACEILGVDPKETPADTWTLREAAVRMVAERDAIRSALARCLPWLDDAKYDWESRNGTQLPERGELTALLKSIHEAMGGV